MRRSCFRPALILIYVVCCMASGALAQQPANQYFHGKTVNIYIGAAAGGGFDAYGRLLARHLGKYIPGDPDVVVENMPGAGSGIAASYIFNKARKDGTAIGALQPGAITEPLLSERRVPYEPSKFIYIGSAANVVNVCLVRSDAPVKSFKETFTKEVTMGASGQDGSLYQNLVILNNVLGTKLRIVNGYAGGNEVNLALDRGEVQGECGQSWSSLNMQHHNWIANKFIRIISQDDLKGQPELNKMKIPLTVSFAKKAEDRQILELFYSQNLFGKPYLLPPGVPAARVAVLRKAFMAALHDKGLLAEAHRLSFDIAPMSGEDLDALVTRLYAFPARTIEAAKRAMVYKPLSK